MAPVSMEKLHRELHDIKNDLAFLKHVVAEDYELSAWAKKELSQSRKIPDSRLVSHDEVKRRILQR